jgi:pimeloyl-ACP methyl ester carboxylesterase
MPRLKRPDGAEIEWRVQGDHGPLVAIAMMALQPPYACDGIVAELAVDHRLLTYDLRGTGRSSRIPGPYDVVTDAADLAALVEEAGGNALVIGLGDGGRRAVRAGAERLDLIHTVVISGETPLGRTRMVGSRDALADSPAVLEALLELLETDYRTGLRTMLESSGDPWPEESLHTRLDAMEAHCPPEVGVPRMRSWTRDDSLEHAQSLGERLWYLHFPGNAWFKGSLEAIGRGLPRARLEAVSEGVISSPHENAAAVRRIFAARRAAA